MNRPSLPARRAALSLAVLALAASAGPALAADSAVTVTSTGSVSMTQPTVGNFAGVSTTVAAVSTSAAVGTFSVTDTTVPASGWKVQVSATRFCTGSQRGTTTSCPGGTNALPLGSMSHSAPLGATGSNGPAPTLTPVTSLDGSSGSTLVSAGSSTTGTWTMGSSTLTLTVPGAQAPGTYTSAITYTVSQGP